VFSWLAKRSKKRHILGIDFRGDGFAMALVDGELDHVSVRAAGWFPLASDTSLLEMLKLALRQFGADGVRVVATLQSTAYSLVQLENPGLEADELREAMRWKVRDLIDFPVEDAVIDVFELPQSRRPGAPRLLYVVVARDTAVAELARLLLDAGLEITAIDIVEMAIRNLATFVDGAQRPRAYLNLCPGQTVIEIADGEQVYLSRRVLQDYDLEADAAVLQSQMESLALEVQRSLDYFESQYSIGAADRLAVLAPSQKAFDAFAPVAGRFLTVPTARFDAESISGGSDAIDLDNTLTAVGAAIRGVSWAA
jgi:MSHA biogenesis protein MshI